MYSKEIKVKSYDVDRTGNIKLSSMMKYFQQIARENLDGLGMTYDFLREHNIVFVLSKYKIRILNKMHADKKYIFKTSPCAIQTVYFIRDFVVEDEFGNRYAEATSLWVIIDFISHSILRPSKLPREIFPDARLVDFDIERNRTKVREKYDYNYKTDVSFSQLDQNNHLNNCYYADIIFDSIYANDIYVRQPQLQPQTQAYCIDLSFEHEAKFKSKLDVKICCDDSSITIVCHNDTDDNICFSACISG